MNIITRAKFLLLLSLGFAFALHAESAKPKYVFLFIGDGMGQAHRILTEEFARKTNLKPELAMNHFKYQAMTRTCSENSMVTDSAAAVTAIACGAKTNNGRLGTTSDGKRVESVAEVAHAAGMKVGIITSVTINHATPAGFYAHVDKRSQCYDIGLDLVKSGFDYFGGGGLSAPDDKKNKNYCGNIFDLARQAGYNIVTNCDDFAALTASKNGGQKNWAHLTPGPLDFVIDANNPESKQLPSLAQFTAKGIELLENPKGFFMMVEGGKIDYGAHANDAAVVIHETLAMDEAVCVALDFAQRHKDETLIIVTGDHETGGLSLGRTDCGYQFYMERLAGQKMSTEVFSKKITKMIKENPQLAFDDVKPLVSAAYGIQFEGESTLALSQKECEQLANAFSNDVRYVVKKVQETKAHDVQRVYKFANECKSILAAKAGVGWSSAHHTALPVITTATGCRAEDFSGYYENTEIAKRIKALIK